MEICGWGRNLKVQAKILRPKTVNSIRSFITTNKKIIARGLGRSYGDSANNNIVIDTTILNKIIKFDEKRGLITCESGVSINSINELIVTKGWFMPVTPGTSYVTVGGAIASDIHGKNHHLDGTLTKYILSADIMLSDGEIISMSDNNNVDLFKATCGGMGLTGIIISATIKLKSINSTFIKNTILKTKCLEETIEQLEYNFSSPYSVAWLDCLTRPNNFGKSLIFLGEHLKKNYLEKKFIKPFYIPTKFCSFFLNKNVVKVFNKIQYLKYFKNKTIYNSHLVKYFYPLDSILNWNLLYGKDGFIQYQFVIPKKNCIKVLKEILNTILIYNQNPFLAVLKVLGPENKNYLTFPSEGYTLALDFKFNYDLLKLIRLLDKKIIHNGGRIYLAKDSLMSKNTFKLCYPKWDKFQQIRAKYKAINKFSSNQSRRLGLE